MKLFFLLLFLPLFSLSQDCVLKKDTDSEGQPRLTTGFMNFGLGSKMFSLSMDAGKKEIDLFFLIKGMGPKCFNDETIITVNFDDGKSKMELKNTGPTNCDGIMHVTFRNGPVTHAYLQRLSTKKVALIHIAGNDKVMDIEFNDKDKTLMQGAASCVAKEAKTLL